MGKDQATPIAAAGPAGATTASGRRPLLPRRLWFLVTLGLVVTALAVVSLVKAMSVTEGGHALSQEPEVGFVVPHRTRPVAFRLQSIDGKRTVTLSTLEGKPLVINLWATYCSVCKQETPAIAAVAAREKGHVTFVGIDSLEPASAGAAFAAHYHVGYLELSDPTASVDLAYGYSALPITLFISPSGKLLGENLGALTVSSLDHYLVRLFGPAVLAGVPR
jgi:thiol-disulfide isomerase/thioredoxin